MSSEPLWFRLPPPSTDVPAAPVQAEKARVSLTIDGRAIDVPVGTTIIDACKVLGIDIPTLCYLETLTPVNACRVCVVEVEGARVLAPACSRKVEAGMVVKTRSPRVDLSRKLVLELLASSVDLSTAPGLDANSLLVRVGGRTLAPDYVGPVDRRWPPAEDGSPFEVRARVPAGLQPGATAVALVAGEVVSAPAEVHLVPGEAPRCWIPVVQNALDGGTDVYTAGAKALIFITLNGVEEPAPADVRVAVGGRVLEPLHVAAIPGKGGHLVQVQLPAGLGPGRTPLSVVLGDGRAATYDLELLEASREGA